MRVAIHLNRTRISVLVLFGVSLILCPAARATSSPPSCVLPVPDGGDVAPSQANAEGTIARVGQGFLEIEPRSGRIVHVSLAKTTQFYSAFGGDYEPSDLAVGQHVAVWFEGCKAAQNGAGAAAYLQLYSKDPADQPPGWSR